MATTSSLLRDRVTLQLRCVDRVVLHGYVPALMTKYQVGLDHYRGVNQAGAPTGQAKINSIATHSSETEALA